MEPARFQEVNARLVFLYPEMRAGFIYAIVVFIVALLAIAFSAIAIYYISRLKNGTVVLTGGQINAIYFTQIVLLILAVVILIWSIFVFAGFGRRIRNDPDIDDDDLDGVPEPTVVPSQGNAKLLASKTVVIQPGPNGTAQDIVDDLGLAPGTPVSIQPSRSNFPVPQQVVQQQFVPQQQFVTQQPQQQYVVTQSQNSCPYVPQANAVVTENGNLRLAPGLGAPAPAVTQVSVTQAPAQQQIQYQPQGYQQQQLVPQVRPVLEQVQQPMTQQTYPAYSNATVTPPMVPQGFNQVNPGFNQGFNQGYNPVL